MAKQELRVNFTGDTSKLEKSTKKAEKTIKGFDANIGALAKNIALAFGTREIIQFGAEAVKLAAKMEGVERAFSSLSGTSLPELQKATRGTVDNMRLMQAAVNARNFKIPLEQLAGFFEFATKRANETGQSVDYLVNSIVTGIGRKSPLILDNLGISAVELREKLKGVGLESATTTDIARALNEVIQEQEAAFGGNAENALTTNQRLEALSATFRNLQTEIGKSITNSNLFTSALSGLQNVLSFLNTNEAILNINDEIKKLGGNYARVKQIRKDAVTSEEELSLLIKYRDSLKGYSEAIDNLANKKKDPFASFIKPFKEVIPLTEEQQKILEKVAQAQGLWNAELSVFGTRDPNTQIDTLRMAVIALVDAGLTPANEEVKRLMTQLDQLNSMVKTAEPVKNGKERVSLVGDTSQGVTGGVALPVMSEQEYELSKYADKLRETEMIIQEMGFAWEQVGMQFTNVMSSMLADGTMTFGGLVKALAALISKTFLALAAQAALKMAMGDATAGTRSLAAVSAIVGVGAGLLASVPQLASGGIATSPTLAMIGEGRESEAVLPLSKLEYMMENSGGNGYIATTRLEGQDMLLMIERAQKFKRRIG